ncbi:hypothetical protein [Paenibacillus favisporus]|uniref:hypothetical protein n=1 Tax=Paenibacillus favisporus TaxID=221028 RepID=UPI003D293729
MTSSKKLCLWIIGVFLLLASLLFNIFSVKNILVKVYSWHLKQPETIQGGAELLVLFICFCILSFVIRRNTRLLFYSILGLSLVYLKIHSVLFAAVLSFVYLEIILFFGRSILKWLKVKSKDSFDEIFISFIVGIVSWSMCALILSLIGLGGFTELRLLTLIIFIVSIFSKEYEFLLLKIYRGLSKQNSNVFKCGSLFIWILVLTQFARSNTSLDYDSVWYGLRPELVLIGKNSFYDNLGMSMYVHYYPKLYELVMIPISNLGDNSFIYAFTTAMLFLLYLLIYHFLVSFDIQNTKALFYTILLATIPAIANMGSTAKTDIFTTLLIVLSSFYLYKWTFIRKMEFFVYSLCAAFLSFGGKPTSYLYIPLIYLGILLSMVLFRRIDRGLLSEFADKKNKKYYLLLIAAIVGWVLVWYRTLKLTGYPLYPILGGVWEKLGFSLKYPFIPNVELLSEKLSFIGIIDRWTKILFDPSEYTHYVMVWPGNIYIFLFLITIVFLLINNKNRTSDNLFKFSSIVLLMGSAIYYISTIPEGGDGNYFIAPVIICSIVFLSILSKNKSIKLIDVFITIFIPIHIMVMFVSHFSWSWGTSEFDFKLNKTEFDYQVAQSQLLESNGLVKINDYLKQKAVSNCIGFGNEEILNRLPCRFEDVPHINSRYGNQVIVQSEEDFLKYISWAKVKYFIIPHEIDNTGYESVLNVIYNYMKNPVSVIVDDKDFYLIDISSVTDYKKYPESTIGNVEYGDGWYAPENANGSRWMARKSDLILKTGQIGKVTLKGMVSEHYHDLGIIVRIDGEIKVNKTLEHGEFTLDLVDLPPLKSIRLSIELTDSFIPKNIGINADTRELGIFVTEITNK